MFIGVPSARDDPFHISRTLTSPSSSNFPGVQNPTSHIAGVQNLRCGSCSVLLFREGAYPLHGKGQGMDKKDADPKNGSGVSLTFFSKI